MTDRERAEYEKTIAGLVELLKAKNALIEELQRQLAGGRPLAN